MQCAAGHGGITKKELTRNTGILTFNLKEAAKLLRRKKPPTVYYVLQECVTPAGRVAKNECKLFAVTFFGGRVVPVVVCLF